MSRGIAGDRLRLIRSMRGSPSPDHAGLFLVAESQGGVKGLLPSRTEPEQFHAGQRGMIQDPPHQLRADISALIGRIDDHVPDRGAKDVIRQDAPKGNQAVPVPARDNDVGVGQHRSGIVQCSPARPIGLFEQGKQQAGIEIFLIRKCRHLWRKGTALYYTNSPGKD